MKRKLPILLTMLTFCAGSQAVSESRAPVGKVADSGASAAAELPENLLATIKSVGPRGQGHRAAQAAWSDLVQSEADVLPAILEAFRGANPLAVNWLRSAVEAIADRQLNSGGNLPTEDLQTFILNRNQNPRARSVAFEWFKKVAPDRAAKLVPGMLDDPSPELRRIAVQRLIDRAEALKRAGKNGQARSTYRKALSGAVDDDQVKAIVEPLATLGVEVDLQRHFGFLTRWHVIGPFDHRDGVGFEAVYPPEKEIDLGATYQGQLGEVRWKPIETDDDYGLIDIARQIENYKGSCMYLATDFYSDRRRTVEIRLGTPNAWKLWLNGRFLFGREEYHRGMKIDQYRVPSVTLKPGRNTVLFKICQNEQDEDWAQRYQFQLRVCDAAGSPVHSVRGIEETAPRQ